MSMTDYFFSVNHSDCKKYFEGLDIWKEEKFRELQGTYPVIFMSFADIKGSTYEKTRMGIIHKITKLYTDFEFLKRTGVLSGRDLEFYDSVSVDMGDDVAGIAIQYMCDYLRRYYGKNALVLLDEYDTPLQEAYVNDYWKELADFIRSLFNSTFKTNPYLERGLLTGITRVSKESIFSDLNNLEVVTTTSEKYSTSFGFTEKEVFQVLENNRLSSEKENIRYWYDGFSFGKRKDIYNPWSIVNYMKEQLLRSYWILTSSNKLIGDIICRHPYDKKYEIEELIEGKKVHKVINENITFQYLGGDENSLWSLLLAVGYIKAENVVKDNEWTECDVSVTNKEVMSMFRTQIIAMFSNGNIAYENFTRALIRHGYDRCDGRYRRVFHELF